VTVVDFGHLETYVAKFEFVAASRLRGVSSANVTAAILLLLLLEKHFVPLFHTPSESLEGADAHVDAAHFLHDGGNVLGKEGIEGRNLVLHITIVHGVTNENVLEEGIVRHIANGVRCKWRSVKIQNKL
jgi:hypothetical protein